MVINVAKGFIRFFLEKTKFAGICLPPFGIYILDRHISNQSLIKHERVHWAQYERMGFIRFYLTYIYQVIRYGYRNSPMEKEARGEI